MSTKARAAGKGGTIRIGIGGWVFEPWRGTFYPDRLPQKQELAYAAARLTSIEINGTFYGSQKPETFAKWRDETPDGFVFALKGPRFATNRRVLAEAGPSVDKFFASGVAALGERLGPVNWQLAPTKTFDPDDIDAFMGLLPKSVDGRTIRHAVEARHESFLDPAFVALAKKHGVAIVVAGDSKYPQIADVTADFVYARIMGTQESEPLGYAAAALDAWAARAKAWAAGETETGLATAAPDAAPEPKPRDVFLYVISGAKPKNPAAAMALIERVG
ncbi:DUF72 domain-containing protein [Rhodoplanes sp. TEM]|uniref:DUF72 domain-containing protein n=1 Tax=Rhodoplanes tepidamans TaxID=200616 RepID=A0ABT5JK80_RHOTP|nr:MULTISPECIES: DUF72 domain-containing protein [Rhodoplanes]MDC7789410.1 DUF72 domain-containing protein [Rhodoplanes tepidamans]MDC7986462.1 DUF72 domain-containing protein [Rhodoplanes sp. TEM]MDQ0358954.1 uncharacterized protein YecE (DUF72 family) [Rhodoplanes tepidamans]